MHRGDATLLPVSLLTTIRLDRRRNSSKLEARVFYPLERLQSTSHAVLEPWLLPIILPF